MTRVLILGLTHDAEFILCHRVLPMLFALLFNTATNKTFLFFFYLLFLIVGMLGTVTTSPASCGEGVILSLVIIS